MGKGLTVPLSTTAVQLPLWGLRMVCTGGIRPEGLLTEFCKFSINSSSAPLNFISEEPQAHLQNKEQHADGEWLVPGMPGLSVRPRGILRGFENPSPCGT